MTLFRPFRSDKANDMLELNYHHLRYFRAVALGTSPNPIVFNHAAGLQRSKHGTVVADETTGRTKMPGVWAGGDVVTGAATVISAMGAGKRAAADIHAFLMDETLFNVG